MTMVCEKLRRISEELSRKAKSAGQNRNSENTVNDKLRKEIEKSIHLLLFESGYNILTEAAETFSKAIEHQKEVNSKNVSKTTGAEQEVKELREQIDLKTHKLDARRIEIEELMEKLEKVTRDKITSESEKQKQIESMISERNRLIRENSMFKTLHSEVSAELATVKKLNTELSAKLSSTPEPNIQLENELEDTTCAIRQEDMKLKKCTPCRRRYHKSCIDKWLSEYRTCRTCRGTWIE